MGDAKSQGKKILKSNKTDKIDKKNNAKTNRE